MDIIDVYFIFQIAIFDNNRLSEKQQKERNYEIFSSIEQYEKGYPNETAVLGWILVLGSGEGNSRYVHKG